jgi:DnaJ-class molecular chaperone
MNADIDSYLRKKGLVLFNYETFPVDVLNYHQEKGHILIGERTWIKPEQLCKKCSGNGEIMCAKCQGFGRINRKCEKCQNGRIACHICEGSGYRPCSVCNGVGKFLRTCSRCGGSGVISGYYSYPSGPSLYLSSGAITVGSFTPGFCYPSYSSRTCPACGGYGNISIACSYCGGSGSDCQGKGRIPCPDCKGKGFNGEAQQYPGEDVVPESDAAGVSRGARSQKLLP